MRGRCLNETERIHIDDRLREKVSVREIACEPGRAPSAISREIRRDRHPANGHYRPHAAQTHPDARRPRPKPIKISQDPGVTGPHSTAPAQALEPGADRPEPAPDLSRAAGDARVP
uniref:helix-turn-helix domain-containing protein n=1 Tax=Nonomuraea antri TaxID=2730852 RepID=UPI001C2C78B3|nr:helix-turn-helix domain-containing protein [Nonomuraea antri]